MIKISVVSYNNEAPAAAISAVFGQDGGTVGRSDDNYFVLPDAKHYVSRLQAKIKSDGTRHTIANLSKANPILVNKHEIDAEREYDLHPGDEIQIGLYMLRAESLSSPVNGDSTPAESAAGTPLAHRPELPRAIAVAAVPAGPHAETAPPDHGRLMQAFLHGAGVPSHAVATELTPELMEMIGGLLAAAVKGTIKLNASRASVKKEVKADVTMVVVRNNNPLKFFPDTQTVLVQMLRKKMPGFLGPVEAMEEALEDLHTHQQAVVAAMRIAAHDNAASFAPEYIETKLKNRSLFDALIPASRKAKLWDLYASRFNDAYLKAEDDTQTPFGKAFLRAYEKEIERMENGVRDD